MPIGKMQVRADRLFGVLILRSQLSNTLCCTLDDEYHDECWYCSGNSKLQHAWTGGVATRFLLSLSLIRAASCHTRAVFECLISRGTSAQRGVVVKFWVIGSARYPGSGLASRTFTILDVCRGRSAEPLIKDLRQCEAGLG